MKKLLKFLAAVCFLMLLNDLIELILSYRKRQKRIRKEAIDRLKRNKVKPERRRQDKMSNDRH